MKEGEREMSRRLFGGWGVRTFCFSFSFFLRLLSLILGMSPGGGEERERELACGMNFSLITFFSFPFFLGAFWRPSFFSFLAFSLRPSFFRFDGKKTHRIEE